MVVGQGVAPAGAGLVVGIIGALASGRVLEGFLYGVSPYDPLVLLGASVALLLVGVVASLVPARRATAVDPVTVLQSE
jgi:ABC-type antimicrobial peptide transport system permease subunit